MAATRELSAYINDHLGGANVGVAMAYRLQHDVQGEDAARLLGPLADEIKDDLQDLRRIAQRVEVTRNPVKQAVGRLAEKIHRLGVATFAPGSRPLRRLRAVESLSLGVEGKLALWRALIEIAPCYPQLDPVDLERLAGRAADQRRRLEMVRHAVVRRAFGA